MGEKWTDKDERDYDARCQRIEEAQQEMAPEIPQEQIDREAIPDYALVDSRMREQRAADGQGRTPEQRAADARPRVRLSEHEELELKLDCHYEMIQEQSALITGQRAAIEELRGWIQERDDGVSNLGMRVAKLEDKLDRSLDTINGGFEALNVFYDRVVAALPSAGESLPGEREL